MLKVVTGIFIVAVMLLAALSVLLRPGMESWLTAQTHFSDGSQATLSSDGGGAPPPPPESSSSSDAPPPPPPPASSSDASSAAPPPPPPPASSSDSSSVAPPPPPPPASSSDSSSVAPPPPPPPASSSDSSSVAPPPPPPPASSSDASSDAPPPPPSASSSASSAGLCGNGTVNAGEECDDGNGSNTDGCLNSCTNSSCGDGYRHAVIEACDDGNTVSGDGCSATCSDEGTKGPGGNDGGDGTWMPVGPEPNQFYVDCCYPSGAWSNGKVLARWCNQPDHTSFYSRIAPNGVPYYCPRIQYYCDNGCHYPFDANVEQPVGTGIMYPWRPVGIQLDDGVESECSLSPLCARACPSIGCLSDSDCQNGEECQSTPFGSMCGLPRCRYY